MQKPGLVWDDIRVLLAVAEYGSGLAASKRLSVNPSTVQRRLRALNAALGFAVTERRGNTYSLSEAGRVLLAKAQEIDASVFSLLRQAEGYRREATESLTVTCPVTIGYRLLKTEFIQRFEDRHPKVRVELLMMQRFLDISRREADVAIRTGKPGSEVYIGRRLGDLSWSVFASRKYLHRHGAPAKGNMRSHRRIEMGEDIAELRAARWMRVFASEAQISVRCATLPAIRLAASAGAGLAILPSSFGRDDQNLVQLIGPVSEIRDPLYVLVHRDLKDLPRVRAFMAFCTREGRSILLGLE